MNRCVVALTVSGLATILVSATAHARNDAFDGKGNLFVADADRGTIFKFTADGKKSMFASGLMPDDGYDLAFDRTGNLFVSDEENELVLKFTPQGKRTTFGTGVRARALIFDNAGNLFVPDYNNQSIFKFTPVGKKSTFARDLSPGAVAFDSAGNLFVSDSRSNSILKFTPDRKKSTFASGVSPWSWLLTVRVIFLPRIITATQSSNSLRMESKAPSPRILPLTVCTTLPLTQRTISSSWIVAAKPSSNSRLMERRQRLLLATLQGRALIKRAIFMFGKAGRS